MSVLSPIGRLRQLPDFVSVSCSQCGTAFSVHQTEYDSDPTIPVCRQCRRGEAEREVVKARNIIDDLIRGEGEFAVFNQLERQEQLASLGIDTPARISTVVLREAPDEDARYELEERLAIQEADAKQDAAENPDLYEPW